MDGRELHERYLRLQEELTGNEGTTWKELGEIDPKEHDVWDQLASELSKDEEDKVAGG